MAGKYKHAGNIGALPYWQKESYVTQNAQKKYYDTAIWFNTKDQWSSGQWMIGNLDDMKDDSNGVLYSTSASVCPTGEWKDYDGSLNWMYTDSGSNPISDLAKVEPY